MCQPQLLLPGASQISSVGNIMRALKEPGFRKKGISTTEYRSIAETFRMVQFCQSVAGIF